MAATSDSPLGKLTVLKAARHLLNENAGDDDDIQKSIAILDAKIEDLQIFLQQEVVPVSSVIGVQPNANGAVQNVYSVAPAREGSPLKAAKLILDDASPVCIREVILCRSSKNILGFAVQCINKEIYVSWLQPYSPADLSGLKFGDQLLTIDGKPVCEISSEEVGNIFKNINSDGTVLEVIEKPFEHTHRVEKDSTGRIGFGLKNRKIKDPVDKRLAKHYLLKVNGQSVIALKDKHIRQIIEQSGPVVTVIVVPKIFYERLVKRSSFCVHAKDEPMLDAFF